MKKYIVISAFFMCATPAIAGTVEYNYDVIADGFYGYSEYADRYRLQNKHNHTPVSAEIYTSAIYHFDDNTAFTLGLDGQISGGKEIEDYNQGEWGENIYGTLETSYGELSVGQIYNAAYQIAVGAPSIGVFRVNNSRITDFIINPNWQRHSRITSYRTLNSTFLNTDADAFKVSYTTPEFYHTKAAVSYAPESYSKAGLINKHSLYENRSSYAFGLYNDLDLDYIEVESSLGYAYNHKNNQEISAGLSLYRKGWTLGGSYRKSFTSSHDYALNQQPLKNMPFYFDGYRRGHAFNVGLSYEIGPFKTGISYFRSESDRSSNKDNIAVWANRLACNKYLAIYLTQAYAEYKGAKTLKEGNQGYAIIGGLELNL